MRVISLPRHLTVLVCTFVLGFSGAVWSAEPAVGDPGAILVELFLAPDRKIDLDVIKKEFAAVGVTKVRSKFFRVGNPPSNLAVGRNVSAPIARLAIRLAQTYNREITLLLPEERLAPDYIAFGTSIFDESFQIPVSAENLARLADPGLTTEQFHALYRQVADINRPRSR